MGKQLAKAGYDVTVLVDDQATPGPVFRALQTRPTVIYFATHGGEDKEHHINAIAVAGFIGAAAEKGVSVGRLTPSVAVKRLHCPASVIGGTEHPHEVAQFHPGVALWK